MPTARAAERPGTSRLLRWALLAPATLFMLAFFVGPMGVLVRTSFDVYTSGGGMTSGLTGANYAQALSDPLEQSAIIRTVVFSLAVTAVTILVSYPIAFFLARLQSRWRAVLLVLALAPLLTADVVRVYGWLVILSPSGLVNGALLALHVISEPLTLVYNLTGAFIGLVEILMPYAILTLFSALVSYDPSLEEASMSLGGNRRATFLRVTLPLSLPVIALTALLLFVLTISSYVTPNVLGGGRVFLVATEIYRQASLVIDWPLASALGVILLVGAAAVLIGYGRLVRAIEARVRG